MRLITWMNNNQENNNLYDYPDAVIVAVESTDNFDLSHWWIEAVRMSVDEVMPEHDETIKPVLQYLSNAVFAHHPNIISEKWNNRSMKNGTTEV